jgi:transposase-like protein
MKPTLSLIGTRTRTSPKRRRQLLAAFERSGLSAAAFARQHGIVYTTLCSWRRRRPTKPKIAFAEVEVLRSTTPEPIVVELGSRARVCVSSPGQFELAAGLLKRLEAAC